MVFRVNTTWAKPSRSQSGFPEIGAEEQTSGDAVRRPSHVPWANDNPTKGRRSWFRPESPSGGQRGFPAPEGGAQARPPGSMPNAPPIFGDVINVYTPYYSRGAAAYAPNFGKTLTNPIGAGIVALHRPKAFYGPAAQYANGAIWWTSQVIPTSVNLQGLTDPQELLDQLGMLNVEAVVRTTG
jgi:hypothetical protein